MNGNAVANLAEEVGASPSLADAIGVAFNVAGAFVPAVPEIMALFTLVQTCVKENRDPTPQEWSDVLGGVDDAHAKAQAALQAVITAKQALAQAQPAPQPEASAGEAEAAGSAANG